VETRWAVVLGRDSRVKRKVDSCKELHFSVSWCDNEEEKEL